MCAVLLRTRVEGPAVDPEYKTLHEQIISAVRAAPGVVGAYSLEVVDGSALAPDPLRITVPGPSSSQSDGRRTRRIVPPRRPSAGPPGVLSPRYWASPSSLVLPAPCSALLWGLPERAS